MNDTKCPECETRDYLVLPGRRNCQTCLKLRVEYLTRRWGPTLRLLADDSQSGAEVKAPCALCDKPLRSDYPHATCGACVTGGKLL